MGRMKRVIPTASKVVWLCQALLLVATMFTASRLIGLIAFLWFVAWEAKGVITAKGGDTLSEACWKVCAVQDNRPTNLALFFVIYGAFVSAGVLFAWLAWAFTGNGIMALAAACLAAGTLTFLARHLWRGDSR